MQLSASFFLYGYICDGGKQANKLLEKKGAEPNTGMFLGRLYASFWGIFTFKSFSLAGENYNLPAAPKSSTFSNVK